MIAAAQSQVPAIETACALYEQHGAHLGGDLQNYLRHPHGWVIKRPDLLLLARPLVLDEPTRWLGLHELGEANAWYVHFLVARGGPAAALREMPFILPFCCWYRHFRDGATSRLHVVNTATILQKAKTHG